MTKDVRREEERKAEERRVKKLAEEVTADFLERRQERKSLESGWLLNMNFMSGNQYCDVSPYGGVAEEDKAFYWQSRRVFNHIAPTVDSRLTKLARLTPTLRVRAFSDEDGDLKAAKLATGVLNYVQEKIGLSGVIARANLWSETCGSVFYKVTWDEKGGRQIAVDENGSPVYEGEVAVSVVPPFEIFPDRLSAENLDEMQSVIHAQVVGVDYVWERFGVEVEGKTVDELSVCAYSEPAAGKALRNAGFARSPRKNSVILLERYTRPTANCPDGKLEIVAGGKLLYEGPLPYENAEKNVRGIPFVKQDCMRIAGAFFGVSVVDRMIPVQRAYNAVRNRKHEFLNRLSMGVMAVEDGSVDVDELAEEGFAPGKILVYRQGSKAPEALDFGAFPSEFAKEEEWLEKEFSLISGVSDLSQNSTVAQVTSATGLQLLLSQDDARLASTVDSLTRAAREIGRQALRLYRQFAGSARLMTLTGEDKRTQLYYFNASELETNDIQFESDEVVSPEERRETVLRLYEAGLLTDEDGKVNASARARILDAFGFGSVENTKDVTALHIARAGEENLAMKSGDCAVAEYDDHDAHLLEHTRFLLSAGYDGGRGGVWEKRIVAHMREHRKELNAGRS